MFQLVNQAVDFVLSRIDVSVGTRDESIQVPIQYELPPAAVTEAIVNAVAHRDYNSNGSIQVMLFKDRLEIWNPGSLPYGLTTAKLRKPHSSIPANPLLAEPMYLAGFIETWTIIQFDFITEPIDAIWITHVDVFNSDGLTIGQFQMCDDVAQFRCTNANFFTSLKNFVQIGIC